MKKHLFLWKKIYPESKKRNFGSRVNKPIKYKRKTPAFYFRRSFIVSGFLYLAVGLGCQVKSQPAQPKTEQQGKQQAVKARNRT